MNSISRRILVCSLAICSLQSPVTAFAQKPPGSDPRADAPKTTNTPREFPKIKSKAEWQARAKQIREQVLVSCGLWPLPEKTPLHAHVFGKIERDGYSVEKAYFQTLPGFYLAGNLYRPLGKGNGPFPAILNPHGHWTDGRMADTTNASIAARCLSFARQGMIAFSYDLVGFNDTRFADWPADQDFSKAHRRFATNAVNQLWSISLMGLQTWNSIRALDFLESLPDVDKNRLACTGESGGGTQTFMLGAVDDRLAAQAPVVMVSHTMQGGCSCENAPGLRVEYSNMEIAAAAALRPQILVGAAGDWTKDTLTVEGPAIDKIYRLFNTPETFRYARFDFGHNFNQTSREAVYEWFGRWLMHHPNPGSLKEAPYQKEPNTDLRVWPDGKLPADAVSEAQVIDWLIKRSEAQLRALKPTSKRSLENYKRVMLPAWQRTLQVEWPAGGSRPEKGRADLPAGQDARQRVSTTKLFSPAKTPPSSKSTVVVLAHSADKAIYCDANGAPVGVAKALVEQGQFALLLEIPSDSQTHNQFTNFFTTYNRTVLQERVRELIAACDHAKLINKHSRVILCGSGRAGLWALLAAPAADGVIADCDELDVASDEGLLAEDLFCPGLRKLGAFEGAATLAAPHPILLHNTGNKFPTETLRAAYHATKADRQLRIESAHLSEDELTQWISQLK